MTRQMPSVLSNLLPEVYASFWIIARYDPPPTLYPQCSQACQRTNANQETIESLAPRVKALSTLLCTSVSEGDIKERERRKKLEQ